MNAADRYARRRRRESLRFWLTILVLAAFGLLATLARGQCISGMCPAPPTLSAPQHPTPDSQEVQVGRGLSASVCRVFNRAKDSTTLGSGVLIRSTRQAAYVLTCDHLFSEGVGNLSVAFSDAQRFAAKLVKRDSQNDLALIQIAPVSHTPLEHDTATPTGWATAMGYGGQGRLRAIRGRIAGNSRPLNARYPSLMVQGAVRSGDSGGPLVNDRGKLVGIVWGVRSGVTYATFGQPVSIMLAALPQDVRPDMGMQPLAKPAQPPSCKCNGDCLTTDDLEHYAKQDQLVGLASQADLNLAVMQFKQELEEVRRQLQALLQAFSSSPAEPPSDHRDLVSVAAPAVFAALGVSGPLGLAWWLFRLWRRRHGDRRGPGGPRRRRFPAGPQEANATQLPMEPGAGPGSTR